MKCIICGQSNPEEGWAALYIRLSEDKTIIDDKGNRVLAGENVDDQKDKLSAMAHRDGFCISVIYNDNDKVASDPENKPRPDFLKMLSEAGQEWTRIYIRHLDRLYRTPEDLGSLAKAFEPHKITVHQEWSGHPLDLTSPMGFMVAGIMAQVAKYETDHKRMRQVAMNKVRMLKGEMYSGVHPYGWNKDNKTLNEPEAEVIRDATARILKGESFRSIMKELNDKGIPSPRGGMWDGNNLRQVLTRTANAGIVTYKGKMVAVEAQWEPIVSKSDFYALQRLIESRDDSDWSRESKYMLTGMVTCGECGSACYCTYTQQTRKGKTYRYDFYQCKDNKCASVSKQALEDYVVEHFLNMEQVMTQSFAKVDISVDAEAITQRRTELAAELLMNGADRLAILDEMDALDQQEDKLVARLMPTTIPVTTAYLWSLVGDDPNAARNELSQHLAVTIHRGGKGRMPIDQKVTITEKGTVTDALDLNKVIHVDPSEILSKGE